jgi:hypothetical protein
MSRAGFCYRGCPEVFGSSGPSLRFSAPFLTLGLFDAGASSIVRVLAGLVFGRARIAKE